MKICIVLNDLKGKLKNDDESRALAILIHHLHKDHAVNILAVLDPNMYLNIDYAIWKKEYVKLGVNVLDLKYPNYKIENHFLSAIQSYLVYYSLKDLSFDLIIFPHRNGLAYYSLMAKKLSLSFNSTSLITIYQGAAEWRNFNNNILPNSYSALVSIFLEKKSCLLSDHIYFPNEYARKNAIDLGYYNNKSQSEILFYPVLGTKTINLPKRKIKKFNEICYVGNFDTRSGILLFLTSISFLSNKQKIDNIKITILGDHGLINSQHSALALKNWSLRENFDLNILSNLDNHQALDYLKSNNLLAVLPSFDEVFDYNLIQLIEHNIPFVCSGIDAYIEIIKFLKPSNYKIFKNKDPVDLSNKILLALGSKQLTVSASQIAPGNEKCWSQSLVALKKKEIKVPLANKQKISVCITYYDRPQFLIQLLTSLIPIDSFINEIIIYIKNDDSKESKNLIKSFMASKKIKCINKEADATNSKARNILARQASSDILLYVDDDNIIDFVSLKKILKSDWLEWDIICSPLKRFYNSKLKLPKKAYSANIQNKILNQISDTFWLPTGGSIPLSLYHNNIGGGDLLIKRNFLLQIGGYNEEINYGMNQELLVRSIHSNGRYLLSPEPFIFYRHHQSNLSTNFQPFVESIPLISIILKGIGQDLLTPIGQLLGAWNFSNDINPNLNQIDQIHKACSNQTNAGFSFKESSKIFKKYIKNELTIYTDDQFVECKFQAKKSKTLEVFHINDIYLNLTIFSFCKFKININEKVIEIEKGFSDLPIEFNEKNKIEFSSNAPATIYLVSVKDFKYLY